MHDLKELVEAQSPKIPENKTKRATSAYSKSERKRGTLLTLWLVLLIIANAGGTLLNILRIRPMPFTPFTVPLWASYTLTVGSVLIVVSAIAMLKWKKWGFYLFCALVVLGFAVNIILGGGVFAFVGLIGIAITYLLLRSSWNLFE